MTPSFIDLWDQAADAWNDFVAAKKDHYKEFVIAPATLALIPPAAKPEQKALDLCCGEGYYARRLKALGYRTYGVDLSPRMIELARGKAADVTYFCADAAELDMFPDASLDLILCGMALMDTPNWEQILREVHRALTPGGLFVFSITHPCFSFEKGGWQRDPDGNKQFFKMDDYFAPDPGVVHWDMPRLKYPFQTKIYHRTLSTYYNTVVFNGFVVEKLVEPHPGADAPKEVADSGRVALYLVFKCRKRVE